jgi:hypothetical protein
MGADRAKNDWSVRYGAIRRAKDRALLAQLEKQITAEEQAADRNAISIKRSAPIPDAINPMPLIDLNDAERNRISRAFGRPHWPEN